MKLFLNITKQSQLDPGVISAANMGTALFKWLPHICSVGQGGVPVAIPSSLVNKFRALNGVANVVLSGPEQVNRLAQFLLFDDNGNPFSFQIARIQSVLSINAFVSSGGAVSPVGMDGFFSGGDPSLPLVRTLPRFCLLTDAGGSPSLTPFRDSSIDNQGNLVDVPVVVVQPNGGLGPAFLANGNRLFFAAGKNIQKIASVGWQFELKDLMADGIAALQALRTANTSLTFGATVSTYIELDINNANGQPDGEPPVLYGVIPTEWNTKTLTGWPNLKGAGNQSDPSLSVPTGYTTSVNGFIEAICVPLGKLDGNVPSPAVGKTSTGWAINGMAAGPANLTGLAITTGVRASLGGFVPLNLV